MERTNEKRWNTPHSKRFAVLGAGLPDAASRGTSVEATLASNNGKVSRFGGPASLKQQPPNGRVAQAENGGKSVGDSHATGHLDIAAAEDGRIPPIGQHALASAATSTEEVSPTR